MQPTTPLPSTPSVTTCALCEQAAPLEVGHIVPAFVVKWVKQTSATGYLRLGASPNRREQDGFKVPLLCGACEDRFSD